MAFKYHGDLVFSTGEYEKDGETKKRWSKAGAVFRDDETGSISIKLEAVPAGPDWSGWMKIFTKDKSSTPQPKRDETPNDIDDKPISLSDIPF